MNWYKIAGGNSGNLKDVYPSTIEGGEEIIYDRNTIVPSVQTDARVTKRKRDLQNLRNKKKEQLKQIQELAASKSWYKKVEANRMAFASGVDWEDVDSSFIVSVAYEDETSNFHIKLKGGKDYSFKQVPRKVYDNLLKAESKGRVFNDIKQSYELY